jgi:uncharacterized membrane protein YadS
MIKNLEGIAFSLLFAFISMYIANTDLLLNLHINPFIVAISIGVIVSNSFKIPDRLKSGITFTSKKILRFAIILLGFKISINEIMNLGLESIFVITICVLSCFIFTVWIGEKLGVDKKLATLLASGTSICGASAIIATNEIIKADDKDSAILNEYFYSVWVGSSIQEVAQVVGAGFSINDDVGKLSSLIKMSRVTFIVPTTFILLFLEIKKVKSNNKIKINELNIPWFVLMFVFVIFINSLKLIPSDIVKNIIYIDNLLLTSAMFCLGLGISFSKLKEAGIKPIYLGFISGLQISITSFIMCFIFFYK